MLVALCKSFENTLEQTRYISDEVKINLKQQCTNTSERVFETMRSIRDQFENLLRSTEMEESLIEAKDWLINFKEMVTNSSTWRQCQTLSDIEMLFKV